MLETKLVSKKEVSILGYVTTSEGGKIKHCHGSTIRKHIKKALEQKKSKAILIGKTYLIPIEELREMIIPPPTRAYTKKK